MLSREVPTAHAATACAAAACAAPCAAVACTAVPDRTCAAEENALKECKCVHRLYLQSPISGNLHPQVQDQSFYATTSVPMGRAWSTEYILEFFLRCRAILLVGLDTASHRRLCETLQQAGYTKCRNSWRSLSSVIPQDSCGENDEVSLRSPRCRRTRGATLPRILFSDKLYLLQERQRALHNLGKLKYEPYRIGLLISPGDELDYLTARVLEDRVPTAEARAEFDRICTQAVPLTLPERQKWGITANRSFCLNDQEEIGSVLKFVETELAPILTPRLGAGRSD